MFFKFYGQSSSFDAVPKISLAVVCTTDRMTTCVGFCLFGPQALGANYRFYMQLPRTLLNTCMA